LSLPIVEVEDELCFLVPLSVTPQWNRKSKSKIKLEIEAAWLFALGSGATPAAQN